jgi:hypothetical protein
MVALNILSSQFSITFRQQLNADVFSFVHYVSNLCLVDFLFDDERQLLAWIKKWITDESFSQVLASSKTEFLVISRYCIDFGGLNTRKVKDFLFVAAIDCISWTLE